MRYVFSIVALLLSIVLGYLLYNSIKEPIAFGSEKTKRESAVQSQLMKIRDAQNVYKLVTGKYAPNFDTLTQVLNTGKIEFVKKDRDPNFPDDQDKFITTSTFSPAIDSIKNLGIANVEDLRYVPFSNKKTQFNIDADTLRYQATLVHVVEVGTTYDKFMGEFADDKYKKYDKNFDKFQSVKFGDMTKPTTSGNW